MLVGQLPRHEHRERDHHDDGQRDDGVGVEPVEFLALVQHHLQAAHPQHEHGQADAVDGSLDDRRLALVIDAPRHGRGEDAHGDVDVEDPGPGPVVGDVAAQQGPGHRRHQRGDAPQRERRPRLLRWIGGQQQRLRQRDHGPGHEALQHAERDQQLDGRRQAAQDGRDHEQDHAHREQPHRAEALREPARERHRDRVGHAEARDDPRALRDAHAQVARDRRQRDVGDGRVEHVHERRQRQRQRAHHERAPFQRRARRWCR